MAAPEQVATTDDLSLMRDFIDFAIEPSVDAAERLPLAPRVQLGLSSNLKATLDDATAHEASAWVLRAKYFRAYVGPFNALELIQRHAHETRSQTVRRRSGAFDVSVGDHPHCASPPVPAPKSLQDHRRVSVQPSETSIDSCLSWFSVDLFVDDEGLIAAVTLDIWEP